MDRAHPGRCRNRTERGYPGGMEEQQQRSGLSLFDGVLIIGGGLIALFVAFKVFGFIAGLVWFVIKLAVVAGLVMLVARLMFRRRS